MTELTDRAVCFVRNSPSTRMRLALSCRDRACCARCSMGWSGSIAISAGLGKDDPCSSCSSPNSSCGFDSFILYDCAVMLEDSRMGQNRYENGLLTVMGANLMP